MAFRTVLISFRYIFLKLNFFCRLDNCTEQNRLGLCLSSVFLVLSVTQTFTQHFSMAHHSYTAQEFSVLPKDTWNADQRSWGSNSRQPTRSTDPQPPPSLICTERKFAQNRVIKTFVHVGHFIDSKHLTMQNSWLWQRTIVVIQSQHQIKTGELYIP